MAVISLSFAQLISNCFCFCLSQNGYRPIASDTMNFGLTGTMFTNKVITNSVYEHHPNTNTNVFRNMDNPEVA